ncbi:MAG: sigma-70 family RNA polymerase sigma factor [Myxococcaceae bacterium]|nr:sigma-70 family RNA polymerase sigma factor [Myxococcaceae bacterium]
MELENDRQWLEGYRRGDGRALEHVYRHYSPRVLRVLARQNVGPLDLDAAHQETFIRAFSETARLHFDGLQPFERYLFAIARRAAIDVLRAHGKLHHEALPLDETAAAGQVPSEHDTPEQAALRAETVATVRAFLSTLRDDELQFATARFIDGLSQEQAGARVGWSRQNARTREARLKVACLAFLRERGWSTTTAAARTALTAAVLSLFAAGGV